MGIITISVGLAALIGPAFCQTTKRYCDTTTSICYAGWTGGNSITIGVALPKPAPAPYDTVLQIVSPIANGWVGFSWGGTMPYVPLTLGWVNNASSTTIYSSRMALGLSLPQPYDGAEYSYLKGTGYNQTHWTLNVRCKGCSQWTDVNGNLTSINSTSTAVAFAHAYTSKLPSQPANNRSTFNVHSSFGHWTLDLTQAYNTDFDNLVSAALVPDVPPPSSSTPPPSSISTVLSSSTSLASAASSTVPTQTSIPSSCAGVSASRFPTLTADGWKAVKVAGDLTQPRGLLFDKAGNLLVVQNGLGISAHTIGPDGCFSSSKTILTQRTLNHGIALSNDGKTLYASSPTTVYAWAYDSATVSVNGSSQVLVTGMSSKGHVTRTLAFPPKNPNILVVSHGSNDNFDYAAADMKVGRSCVKAFDLSKTPTSGYDYATTGYQLGYGLRNEVGLAFDESGGLWGLENASDDIQRTVNGKTVDIHLDNPADELNYLGDPSKENTQWYGYPTCYTVWSPGGITDRKFAVGDQFVLAPNATFSDDTCKRKSSPANLVFQAHSAPLDAVFNRNYSSMYVTFHGSSDRALATGYKVVEVPFSKGAKGFGPTAALNSTTGYKDIFWNPEVESCSATQCFRPVSIAKDRLERMYITSDSGTEGELILLGKA